VGAFLENQGEDGSKGQHWERHFFGEELMTADDVNMPVLSAVTLA